MRKNVFHQHTTNKKKKKESSNGATKMTRFTSLVAVVAVIAVSTFSTGDHNGRRPRIFTEAFSVSRQWLRPNAMASSSSSSSSLKFSLVDAYNLCLEDFPLATQAVTASCMAGIGDVLAQVTSTAPTSNSMMREDATDGASDSGTALPSLSRKKDQPLLSSLAYSSAFALPALPVQVPSIELDTTRLQRFMLKGLGGGMLWGYWFSTSDGLVASIMDSLNVAPSMEDGVRTALFILLEQCLWSPIVFTFWEIPVPTLLATPEERARMASIPEQIKTKFPQLFVDNAKLWTFVNMLVYNIPVQYRVLLSSSADIMWMMIVSKTVMGNSEEIAVERLAVQEAHLFEELLLSGETSPAEEAAAELLGEDAIPSTLEEDLAELSPPELLHY